MSDDIEVDDDAASMMYDQMQHILGEIESVEQMKFNFKRTMEMLAARVENDPEENGYTNTWLLLNSALEVFSGDVFSHKSILMLVLSVSVQRGLNRCWKIFDKLDVKTIDEKTGVPVIRYGSLSIYESAIVYKSLDFARDRDALFDEEMDESDYRELSTVALPTAIDEMEALLSELEG